MFREVTHGAHEPGAVMRIKGSFRVDAVHSLLSPVLDSGAVEMDDGMDVDRTMEDHGKLKVLK